eukprot:gene5110-5472_t
MSLRSDALENEENHKFIDPISLDIMNDPVIASDGHSYERVHITEWFKKAKQSTGVILSPLTGVPLPNETLRSNLELKAEIDEFKASKSSIQTKDIKFTLSSEIYKELDRISQMKQLGELDLKPPKIIVVGNESHGKSTLLERIVNLPIFPKAKGICTRCIIRVHLRRCLPTEPSIAEVSLLSPIAEKGFYQVSALDNIREKIQDAMQFLIDNDTKKRMIIDDNEVVVKIKLPYVLNVDILDLPGLVTTARESSGQNLPDVTKRLASKIVMENKDCSVFLLVNDIRVPPNQSRGCEVIQECKVESKTLGVFTKLDAFVSEDGDEAEELTQSLNCKADSSFSVGYGWMVASSKKMPDSTAKASAGRRNELQSIMNMESRERKLFESKYESANRGQVLGVLNIRQKIQNIYERFISDHWVPHILEKFQIRNNNIEEKLFQLGVPLAAHPSYNSFPGFQSTFKVISLSTVASRMNSIIDALTKDFEELFSGMSNDNGLWLLLDGCHRFFRNESSTAIKQYSAFGPITPDKVIGRVVKVKGHITAKIVGICDNDSFEIEQTSRLLVGQRVSVIANAITDGGIPVSLDANVCASYYPIKKEFDNDRLLEGTIMSDSSNKKMCCVELVSTSSSIMSDPSWGMIPDSLEPDSYSLGTLEVPRNWLSPVKTQVARAEIVSGLEGAILTKEDLINQNYRRPLNGNSSKFVPLDKVNAKKEEMKQIVKDRLTTIFEHLQSKLNPSSSQLEQIILKYERKRGQRFNRKGKEMIYRLNIQRFPILLQTFQNILSDRLTELRNEFRSWFTNFIKQTIDEPPPLMEIITPEFICLEGKVYCYLHWTNTDTLEKFPHLILAKWNEITPERFGKGLFDRVNGNLNMTMFHDEPCREERLKLFQELKELNDLKDDVTAFASKVSITRK